MKINITKKPAEDSSTGDDIISDLQTI